MSRANEFNKLLNSGLKLINDHQGSSDKKNDRRLWISSKGRLTLPKSIACDKKNELKGYSFFIPLIKEESGITTQLQLFLFNEHDVEELDKEAKSQLKKIQFYGPNRNKKEVPSFELKTELTKLDIMKSETKNKVRGYEVPDFEVNNKTVVLIIETIKSVVDSK